MLNSTNFFKFIKMSKSTKSSKRAKMLKLKNYRSVAKSVSLKHLSILKCLSLQNPLRTECAILLSRVNISYMCLNTSRSYWNVCVGRRHENGGELIEGFFLV